MLPHHIITYLLRQRVVAPCFCAWRLVFTLRAPGCVIESEREADAKSRHHKSQRSPCFWKLTSHECEVRPRTKHRVRSIVNSITREGTVSIISKSICGTFILIFTRPNIAFRWQKLLTKLLYCFEQGNCLALSMRARLMSSL